MRPGDRVGVETYGYPPAMQALLSTGAVLVPLHVDAEGVRLDELERALAAGGLVAAYLIPRHQYPTTASLIAPRRLALLALARRHRFALIEDD
ncbi:MAG: hypothetical protein KA712_23630 [Myxococcales bacterium]|nr:hypothetical protein [Myxococcales bacterium]